MPGRHPGAAVTGSHVALLAAAGFLAGSVNTVAGGGSLLSFPALLAVGFPPVAANVTNTVAIWPGYLGGVVAYRRELAGQRQRAVALAAVSAAGAVAGSALLLLAPARVFQVSAPYLILLACALLAAQPRLSRALLVRRGVDPAPVVSTVAALNVAGGRPGGIPAPTEAARAPAGSPVALVLSVFAASVYGAYFGAGLGILLLALLALLVPDTLQRNNGQKVLLSLVINTVALGVFAVFGPVHWGAVLVMVLASLAGGYLGGGVARRLPAAALRGGIVLFGIVVAGVLAVQG